MIYFDAAATTLQKPPAVAAAMQKALRTMSSPGRGGHPAAMLAAETAFQCRSELAALFGMRDPERVVFTQNATHALNIAIKSLVPPGGEVVISGYEHNAVTRPLAMLGADVRVAAAPLFRAEEVAEAFRKQITPKTRAVICNHVSNVFGFIQPIEEVAALCRRRGVPLIVDASQSAGVLPLDMPAMGADFIAMPGHKGLYGPQGTGVLLCGERRVAKTLMEGGTGSLSLQQQMPDFLPDRLEAGTHNMPGIAGLLEGVRYVRRAGERKICEKERQLAMLAGESLRMLDGVKVFSLSDLRAQVGVLSFTVPKIGVESLAERLGERGIAVRAGLHCAPLAHYNAGTAETGTVRLSFSDFNTPGEVYHFLAELRSCLRE